MFWSLRSQGRGVMMRRTDLQHRLMTTSPVSPTKLKFLAQLEKKVIWLSAYMIHNANVLRPKRDGLKVGGHASSSSSMASILTALYFSELRPQDRVAVKPHASPAYHAIMYLMGKQTITNLQRFRGYGVIQSYPSRTKDHPVEVDFSTGSVGLGAAVTAFASYIQDYLALRGLENPLQKSSSVEPDRLGRMIALVGDAELDEGNVYEALLESWKLGVRNNWWLVDYNRQSLDKMMEESSFRQIDRLFRGNGYNVITLKYGKKLRSLFEQPGGKALKRWVNTCGNSLFSSLTYQGGTAFRQQILQDVGNEPGVAATLNTMTDDQLFEVMTNLGGHDISTLLEAFELAKASDTPTAFICYTIKGYGLPLAGHRDNHGLILTQSQMDVLQNAQNIPKGEEWSRYAGLESSPQELNHFIGQAPFLAGHNKSLQRQLVAPRVEVPPVLSCKTSAQMSTQAAFGEILLEISKSNTSFADRIITTAPDVSTSTNLSGFLNQRGIFGRQTKKDPVRERKVQSLTKWDQSTTGQHIELGIAENNLFLLLAAAGLSGPLFGHRLLPIGTLYDPFISRGLDALNYGLYMDSRFMIAATPSGITLSPEGGAHQSIYTPLIGMGQPGLKYFEPSTADELQVIMQWGFNYMQDTYPNGGSVYLRLSTRPIAQPVRQMTPALRDGILKGGYWAPDASPNPHTKIVVAFTGAVMPEAVAAFHQIRTELDPSAALLHVTSSGVLFDDWDKAKRDEQAHHHQHKKQSHVEMLLQGLSPNATLITVIDGHPSTLSWLGGVQGCRVNSLGVTRFGQSGDIQDLYRAYGLHAQAIVGAATRALGHHHHDQNNDGIINAA